MMFTLTMFNTELTPLGVSVVLSSAFSAVVSQPSDLESLFSRLLLLSPRLTLLFSFNPLSPSLSSSCGVFYGLCPYYG